MPEKRRIIGMELIGEEDKGREINYQRIYNLKCIIFNLRLA